MATNLYEILEVPSDATSQQIRKAYKHKALQTHPDRLPPGASPEEKAASEELFRKVNNAYEVLTNPDNRRLYDHHGSWPPPESETGPSFNGHANHRPFSHRPFRPPRDPFFSDPFFSEPFFFDNRPSFGFTDPFSLFDSVFEHSSGNIHHPHFARRRHHERSWLDAQLSSMMRDDFDDPFFGSFGGFGISGMSSVGFPAFPADGSRGQWKSERFVTSSINGVTQTLHQRRDWDGNEHVTRTYDGGRPVHTINGMEQPLSHNYLPNTRQPEARRLTSGHRSRGGSRSVVPQSSYPPPPYPGQPSGGYENPTPTADRSRRHGHRGPEFHALDPGVGAPGNEGPSERKGWW